MLMLFATLAVTAASPAEDVSRQERMVALYDELCLQTFPDDAAIDRLMASKGATALTPEEVRVTLRDDPGRGWLLDDVGVSIQIMIEMPPFHACSVRWMSDSGFGDLRSYHSATDAFRGTRPGFGAPEPYEADIEGLHVTAITEQRDFPDGGAETLMLIEQRVADPARLAKGETRVSVRFVHQIVSPNTR